MHKNVFAITLVVALFGCNETSGPVETVELMPNLDRAATLDNAANLNEELVTYTWKLEDQPQIATAPEPHRARSQEFQTYVTGAQLAAGVEIPLTVDEGAFIALTPINREQIVPAEQFGEQLRLQTDHGLIDPQVGALTVAGGDQVNEQLGEFAMDPNLLTMLTRRAVGKGKLELRIEDANPDVEVMVHVIERQSPVVLDFGVDAVHYVQGETLSFDGRFDGLRSLTVESARMRTPDGSVIDVPVAEVSQHGFNGSVEVPSDVSLSPGELMELEVQTVGITADGLEVRRTAKTAFAIGSRTAALLTESLALEETAEGITVPVEVEVGSQGRYAVTGILYGTDGEGHMQPFLGCQTATMLDPGTQTLSLAFGAEDLADSELTAPYEVRNVTLQDQSRMFVLD